MQQGPLVLRGPVSYIKISGALLLIISCSAAGASAVYGIRRRITLLTELLRGLERMETEICLRCRSLPDTMKTLEKEIPGCFLGLGHLEMLLQHMAFTQVWNEHFRSLDLPEECKSAVCFLGRELAEGADPGSAFSACSRQLRSEEAALREKLEKNGKVYLASGLAAGCLLVITAM